MHFQSFDDLNNLEYSLRNFIDTVMIKHFGEDWINKKITKKTRDDWEYRRNKTQGVSYTNLIFFSYFTDLKNILNEHKNIFIPILNKYIDFDYLLILIEIIIPFRNDTAHGRIITPFDAYIIYGVSNKIRSIINSYKATMKNIDSYLAKIERVIDQNGQEYVKNYQTNRPLIIGEEFIFTIDAVDPQDRDLEYNVCISSDFGNKNTWTTNNVIIFTVPNIKLSRNGVQIAIEIKHKGNSSYDDFLLISFSSVLPKEE